MNFQVVTGLPRSGSTLLCNILAQNPAFKVSSTSSLPTIIGTVINTVSNLPEFKSELIAEKQKAEFRLRRALLGIIEGWYGSEGIVFDKARGWSFHSLTMKSLFPEGKMIILVRDLRNVVASIEKQHQINPLLDGAVNSIGKTLFQRTSDFCAPEGMVGNCIIGIEDSIRRNIGNCIFVKYEDLVKNPVGIVENLYKSMNLPPFKHNFENIINISIDVDGLYLNKFPHEGSGMIKAPETDEWKQYISNDIAREIMKRFEFYNNYFGYI